MLSMGRASDKVPVWNSDASAIRKVNLQDCSCIYLLQGAGEGQRVQEIEKGPNTLKWL